MQTLQPRLCDDPAGSISTEYALLAGLLALGIAVGLSALGTGLADLYAGLAALF